jgi:hypothetical protein
MKKVLKWGSIAVVLLVVIGVAVVYFRLGAIVEYAVESQGSQQMSLKTELDGASVGLFGGEVELDELKIANPPGFEAPHLFTLGGVDVKVPISELRSNPKRVSSITLDKPKLVIERGADGRFNFKAAIDQMPKSPTPTGPAPTEPSPAPTEPAPPAPAGDEMKLIIDELTIKEATVVVRPGLNLPGIAKEFTLTVPTVVMKNIGNAEGAQNGAAVRDVAQQVITVLAANASNSSELPEELRGLLSMDVNAVMAELGTRLGAEAQKRIVAALPGELGARLSAVVADPNALIKDPGKAAEAAVEGAKEELGKRLGEQGIPIDPEAIRKDPGKAVGEGLKGLLGGRKKAKDKEKDAPVEEDEAAPAEEK